jgi:hypothetical protein
MSKTHPLRVELSRWFDRNYDELPQSARNRLNQVPLIHRLWDLLDPERRERAIDHWIAQRADDPQSRREMRGGGSIGWKKASVAYRCAISERNTRNARHRRLNRQKISDEAIARARTELIWQGVTPTAARAFRRLFPGPAPLTLRGFRKRWNNAGFNKKGT